MSKKVQINGCRLAFPNIFERGSYEGKDTGYGATLILSANDPQVPKLRSIIKEVRAAKWAHKPVHLVRQLLRDGEEKAETAGFGKGKVFLRANSSTKPTTFDRDNNPIGLDAGLIYAGAFVDAIVDVYAQDNRFGKAINCGLSGIRFRAHGDAFAGSPPAQADDFADDESDPDDEAYDYDYDYDGDDGDDGDDDIPF
jgi:Enterobacter phage Enc34, ssDNA-binding protein